VFDPVTIRVSDLDASRAFYGLGFERLEFPGMPHVGDTFHEWHDFSISQADGDEPVTRRLHVAFGAPSRAHVDEWWRALTEAGYRDDGAPGPRPQYSRDSYGGFVLDPDGHNVEVVNHNR
jgi:catechol 2,3-dioxygenase-like lactoylglutathione lyase family enzyme